MKRFAFAFILVTLAARALVPTGWMPSDDRAFALTVCTGADTKTIWMDSQGGLHDENPDDRKQLNHGHCAFAAANEISFAGSLTAPNILPSVIAGQNQFPIQMASVGHGLAAPPPPQTGPPILI